MTPKNTICLWYDKDAEAAARFYAETFPDSAVKSVQRAPGDFPGGKAGDVLVVEFTVAGIPCRLFLGSGVMAAPHATRAARRAPSSAFPRRRALCTNAKKAR